MFIPSPLHHGSLCVNYHWLGCVGSTQLHPQQISKASISVLMPAQNLKKETNPSTSFNPSVGTLPVVVFLTHSYDVMSVIIAGTPWPCQSSCLALLHCAASGGLTDDGAQNHSGAIP